MSSILRWATAQGRWHLAGLNRRRLLALHASGHRLLLQPENQVEHYYHFLFDLALPLWMLLEQGPADLRVAIAPFGPFTARLVDLFAERVQISSPEALAGFTVAPLRGMNVNFTHVPASALDGFKSYVGRRFGVENTAPPDAVLLIERMPPDDYFRTHAAKPGAGASRRSIANHEALAECVAGLVPRSLRFLNVKLETMPFQEQVRLFNRAALVVGQHGAGLANVLWMNRGQRVVELSHNPSLMHFKRLSRQKGAEYWMYRTTGPHCYVDCDGVSSVIQSALDTPPLIARVP